MNNEFRKFECEDCDHRWEGFDLSIDSWECPICGSPNIQYVEEV